MLKATVLALLAAAEANAAFTLRKTYDSSNFLDAFNFRDVRGFQQRRLQATLLTRYSAPISKVLAMRVTRLVALSTT